MCWIYLVLDNIQRRAFVKSVINRRFSKKEGKLSISLTATGFTKLASALNTDAQLSASQPVFAGYEKFRVAQSVKPCWRSAKSLPRPTAELRSSGRQSVALQCPSFRFDKQRATPYQPAARSLPLFTIIPPTNSFQLSSRQPVLILQAHFY